MRIGFQTILFLLILNLMSTLVYAISIPGTEYANVLYGGELGNASAYAEEFNTTTLLDQWSATPFSGIPVVGDVFSVVYLLYNGIRSIIVGFPDMINAYAYAIGDATARNAILTANYVVYAVFMFIMFVWIAQLISGRRISQ